MVLMLRKEEEALRYSRKSTVPRRQEALLQVSQEQWGHRKRFCFLSIPRKKNSGPYNNLELQPASPMVKNGGSCSPTTYGGLQALHPWHAWIVGDFPWFQQKSFLALPRDAKVWTISFCMQAMCSNTELPLKLIFAFVFPRANQLAMMHPFSAIYEAPPKTTLWILGITQQKLFDITSSPGGNKT